MKRQDGKTTKIAHLKNARYCRTTILELRKDPVFLMLHICFTASEQLIVNCNSVSLNTANLARATTIGRASVSHFYVGKYVLILY